jgi:ABC-2 type transport system ATP-binding protein
MIRVEGVWKSYDTLVAVRDVSLRLEPSSTLGLIGPNGAGKTTLLRMLATLAKPDRGSIEIDGLNSRDDSRSIRRRIAFMPAEFGSPPDMTMREYMRYFACLFGIDRKDRDTVIDQGFALTDLTGRDEVMVRSLSTGNRQRLLLAKTLLNDPKLLVLDEPSSGLDPRARVEVREILQELAGMGKTIVISSHILADLEEICSHICIMEEGKVVLSGKMDALRGEIDRTRNVFRIRVPLEQMEAAQVCLEGLDGVTSCEVETGWLVAGSEEENCNFVLQALIDLEIRVLELHEDKPDLEDLFITSTAGKVT